MSALAEIPNTPPRARVLAAAAVGAGYAAALAPGLAWPWLVALLVAAVVFRPPGRYRVLSPI